MKIQFIPNIICLFLSFVCITIFNFLIKLIEKFIVDQGEMVHAKR